MAIFFCGQTRRCECPSMYKTLKNMAVFHGPNQLNKLCTFIIAISKPIFKNDKKILWGP